jgi:hypothetical protein
MRGLRSRRLRQTHHSKDQRKCWKPDRGEAFGESNTKRSLVVEPGPLNDQQDDLVLSEPREGVHILKSGPSLFSIIEAGCRTDLVSERFVFHEREIQLLIAGFDDRRRPLLEIVCAGDVRASMILELASCMRAAISDLYVAVRRSWYRQDGRGRTRPEMRSVSSYWSSPSLPTPFQAAAVHFSCCSTSGYALSVNSMHS